MPAFSPKKTPVAATVRSAVPSKPAAASARKASGPAPFEALATIAYASGLYEADPKTGKRSALFIIEDEESIAALDEAIAAACLATFGEVTLPEGAMDPRRDPNETDSRTKEYSFKHQAFRIESGVVVRGKTGFEVNCIWGPNEAPIEVTEIEGGDLVVATMAVFAYDNQSVGVGIGLNKLHLIKKGKDKIERGTGGGGGPVRKIDRSKLKFQDDEEAEAA